MNVFTVSFFGHRQLDQSNLIEQCLESIIEKLLLDKEYVEFLIGRDGEFDQLVSSTVHRCKRRIRNDNSTLVWVMPYQTTNFLNNKESFLDYYDEIEICENAASRHFKAAHLFRNRSMADRSDFVIFYVNRKSGGAWQTMQYAKTHHIPYININTWINKEP